MFELHKRKERVQLVVTIFQLVAGLDPMRLRTPLSLQAPPPRTPLPIQVCNGRLDGPPFEEFRAYVDSPLSQDCHVMAGSSTRRR